MHKVRLAATVAGLAALGAIVPVNAAHAGPNCDAQYRAHRGDGNVRAYDDLDCRTLLGTASGDDTNWANSQGAFQGGDNDKATSVLNTGTASGGWDIVKFYQHAGPRGGYGCLTRTEIYADDLRDNTFHNGDAANNAISAHEWVNSCDHLFT